ncbi:imidazole glycerol phosphate synthase subunit HisH [Methanocella sp. CWC-04]|uniref:Imidazole glycerol phosphate synthase subunit HisH n=1 Tax=Methanooceanicella nereidis TaxID=2052831 RepID=A0AAP2W742_9EURY|nr:imidazole glycerol phosphate synthase subunit HisH [Methanocella sp. CWC-04]MCD1294854.1 imidazole glycerol phosphate synthase subunit HisH [Methanocella sp. CWC-04]
MTKIVIIDYGLGNLRSVEKGLAYAGAPSVISKDISEIESADAIVLPGVGAFEGAMRQFAPLKDAVLGRVKNNDVPLLGVCLGMQMLFEKSEEGGIIDGLGLVPGSITKFSGNLKVPHMGWNSLSIKKKHPILKDIPDGSYVYFVHSYRAEVSDNTLASSEYGGDFTAIVSNDAQNVVGTQFHPEKSGNIGLQMLKNFVDMI